MPGRVAAPVFQERSAARSQGHRGQDQGYRLEPGAHGARPKLVLAGEHVSDVNELLAEGGRRRRW